MELKIINKKGHEFIVLYDESDADFVASKKWYVGQGYVRTWINGKVCMMHRLFLGVSDPKIFVDHKNHNTLDNCRDNIRKCTNTENVRNKNPRGSSKYLGVAKSQGIHKRVRKSGKVVIYNFTYWTARISSPHRKKHIGNYKNEVEAALAYDNEARKYHGEFANLNFK